MSEHEEHDRDDDPLARRLGQLGRAVPASPELTRRVMNDIAGTRPGSARPGDNFHTRRWIMRGIGLAACTVIGTLVFTMVVSTPQPAYGIEDVRDRLARARSLHLVGKAQDDTPFEVYVERPDRTYIRQSSVRIIKAGSKAMMVNDAEKTATLMPADPLDTRWLAEAVLQMQDEQFAPALVGPARGRMRKLRADEVGGVPVDVYESVAEGGQPGTRTEVYFNPRTGLPVKSVLYYRAAAPDAVEQRILTIDRIAADGPPPMGAFDFRAPAGYQLHEVPPADAAPPGATAAPRPAGATVFSSAHGSGHNLEASYTFGLGDRAILMCWAYHADGSPADDLKLPAGGDFAITSVKGGYAEHLLRADPMPDGHHWRWSLLVPSDPSVPVGRNLPTLTVKANRVTLSTTPQALQFPRAELEKMIVEAQRRTLPEGGKAMTLAEIEQKLKEVSGRGL